MTIPYANQEVSDSSGKPTNLYTFAIQAVTYLYTSGDRDISYGGNTYTAIPIGDTGVKQSSGDPTTDDLTVTMPNSSAIVMKFRGTVPSSPIYVTIRNMHVDTGDAVVAWVGTVSAVKRKDDAESEVICRTLAASFDVTGVRLGWTRGCPYALYDPNTCQVDKATYAVAATITAMTATTLTAAAFASAPANDFATGFLSWVTTEGLVETRGISQHNGGSVTVYGLTDGLSVGQAITVYPGCDRTSPRCDTRFGNLALYGGVTPLPGVSPFDGNQIF